MVFNIVVLLLNILVLAVIYIVLRRRIDRLTDTNTMSSRLAGDLDLILAEMNQVTDRNVAIIEDKIKELEDIIVKAENRIKLLTKTVTKPSAPPVKENSPFKESPAAPASQPRKANSGELTYNHLNRMRTMSGMVTPMKVPEREPETEKSIKERVIELYNNGFDSSVIASSIGVNRGEVELIISLHQQMNNKQD